MQPWSDERAIHCANLAALPRGARIAALGCDPGDQAARDHSAALVRVSGRVVGAKTWSRGELRAAPLLADVRVEWAEGVPWRDGSAANRVEEESLVAVDYPDTDQPAVCALVVEGQYWPHRSRRKTPVAKMEAPELRALVRDFESMLEDNGGRFNSLIGLAGCSGVVAGAAHVAGVPVFSAGATSWIPLLGRHGKAADGDNRKAYRRASVELMRLLGGPKRGNKRAAGHDLGAATVLALLGLGVVRLEEQFVEPGPEIAAWLAGI